MIRLVLICVLALLPLTSWASQMATATSDDALDPDAQSFYPPDTLRAAVTSVTTAETVVAIDGAFSGLRVVQNLATPAADTAVYTFYLNGTATALTCSIAATETTCTDDTNSITVAPADLVAFLGDQTDLEVGETTGPLYFSLLFDSTNTAETILMGGTGNSNIPGPDLSVWVPIKGFGVSLDDSDALRVVHPIAGTLSDLFVDYVVGGTGSSTTATFTLEVNGTATALTCTVPNSSSTCSNTSDSVSISIGDLANVHVTSTSNVGRSPEVGMIFTANTDGDFFLSSLTPSDSPSTSATEFGQVNRGSTDWSTTEDSTTTTQLDLFQACTIRSMRVALDVAPDNGGGTQSYEFTLRQNQTDTGLACTVSEGDTTCTNSTTVVISDDDFLSWSVEPTGTPVTILPSIALHVNACEAAVQRVMIIQPK